MAKEFLFFPFLRKKTNEGASRSSESYKVENSVKFEAVKQTSYSPLTSCRKAWQEWGRETTLHGAKFIFEPNNHIIRRIFWTFILGCFLYGLVSVTLAQYERFHQYKTVTKTYYEYRENLTMPAITICNFNYIRNSSLPDEETRSLLIDLYMSKLPSNLSRYGPTFLDSVNLTHLYQNGAFGYQDTFLLCLWMLDSVDCQGLFTVKKTDNGFCFILNKTGKNALRPSMIGSDSALGLCLWTNQDDYLIGDAVSAGFKILINDNNDEESVMEKSVSLSPGFIHFIAMKKIESKFLPHPVKAFGSSKCVDTHSESFVNPLRFFQTYSVGRCMKECKSKYLASVCGCVSPLDIGPYKTCSPNVTIHCYKDTAKNFSMTFTERSCHCPLPCSSTTFETKISSGLFPSSNYLKLAKYGDNVTHQYLRENLLYLRIFFESKQVLIQEQVLEFTPEDLYASFGGYLGLAIGASSITLVEFLEVLFLSIVKCMCPPSKKKDKDKQDKTSKGDNPSMSGHI